MSTGLLAVKICGAYGFQVDDVYNQHFLISKRSEPELQDLNQHKVGKHYIYHGKDLPIAVLTVKKPAVSIAFFGIAVSPDGYVVDAGNLQTALSKLGSIEKIIHYLTHCSGRYAFLISSSKFERLYGDPGNTLGLVYDPESGRVGSTIHLVLSRDIKPNTEYPLDPSVTGKKGARYSFGHTEDLEVKRGLGNHFLDLKTMGMHRFWPTEQHVFEIAETDAVAQDAALDVIINQHRSAILALSQSFTPTILPLSAGRETRMLLSCATECLDQIDYIFSHATNFAGSLDQSVARVMGQAAGREVDMIYGFETDKKFRENADWEREYAKRLLRLGDDPGTLPEAADILRYSVTQVLPEGGILLRGYVSDLLKAVLWERGVADAQTGVLKDDHVMKMMFLGGNNRRAGVEAFGRYWKNPKLRELYFRWKDTLPQSAHSRLYDFSFMELFQAHGHGRGLYGFTRNFYLGPGNDRKVVEASISLPPITRRMLQYHRLLHERTMPAQRDIPYLEDVKDMTPEQRAEFGMVDYKASRSAWWQSNRTG